MVKNALAKELSAGTLEVAAIWPGNGYRPVSRGRQLNERRHAPVVFSAGVSAPDIVSGHAWMPSHGTISATARITPSVGVILALDARAQRLRLAAVPDLRSARHQDPQRNPSTQRQEIPPHHSPRVQFRG